MYMMMTNDIINSKVEAIRKLEKEAELLKQQVDALKSELKDELDSRKVDSLNTGLYNLVYNCYEKKLVDSAKLKADNLYDEYTKTSTAVTFRINDVKVFA